MSRQKPEHDDDGMRAGPGAKLLTASTDCLLAECKMVPHVMMATFRYMLQAPKASEVAMKNGDRLRDPNIKQLSGFQTHGRGALLRHGTQKSQVIGMFKEALSDYRIQNYDCQIQESFRLTKQGQFTAFFFANLLAIQPFFGGLFAGTTVD